jgi:hypothetical protein
MEYTMNAAYVGEYNTKPLTEQQLNVTCMNDHVGHVLWGLTITYEMSPYKNTYGKPDTVPVSVLLSFLYTFTSDYWSSCLHDDSHNFKPQFL